MNSLHISTMPESGTVPLEGRLAGRPPAISPACATEPFREKCSTSSSTWLNRAIRSPRSPADGGEFTSVVKPFQVFLLLTGSRSRLLSGMLRLLNAQNTIRALGRCINLNACPIEWPIPAQESLLLVDHQFMTAGDPCTDKLKYIQDWSTRSLILFDEHPDIDVLIGLVLNGYVGCLQMTSPLSTYCKAIEATAHGELWFPRETLAYAIDHLLGRRHSSPAPGLSDGSGAENAALSVLSERQRNIVQLIRSGLTNKEIGRHLNISDETVKKHLALVFRRFGVRNRTQLAAELRA